MSAKQTTVLELPNAASSEREVIGLAIVDPSVIGAIVLTGLSPDDFTQPDCVRIFHAMRRIRERNIEVDPATLASELIALGYEKDGKAANTTVFDFMNNAFLDNPEHAEQLIQSIRDATVARNIVLACRKVARNFPDMAKKTDGWATFSRLVCADLDEIALSAVNGDFRNAKEVADSTVSEIRSVMESNRTDGLVGAETGLIGLNVRTHGWRPGQLIVIGGKASMGKSAFAINSALKAAAKGSEVAYFSLEMSAESNVKRIISQLSGVPADKLISGMLKVPEMETVEQAAARFAELPFHFNDRLTGYEDIVAAITALKARRPKLEVVYVDYLQLMSVDARGMERYREIGIMTAGMKRLAMQLGIAIVLLSQLKRTEGSDAPTLDDLRESGNIEQDANVVLLLHRPDYFDPEQREKPIVTMEDIVAKNREGRVGSVYATFDKTRSRFDDSAGPTGDGLAIRGRERTK